MTKRDFIWLAYPDRIYENTPCGVTGCPSTYGLSENCEGTDDCGDCWSEYLSCDVIAEAKEDVESLAGMTVRKGEKLTVKECEFSEGKFWAWSDLTFWLCGFEDRSKFNFYLSDKEENRMKSKFELKPGMKVRVKKYDRRPTRWNPDGKMDKYMGKVVTISSITGNSVKIVEDRKELCGCGWEWKSEDFVPVKFTKSDLEDGMMLETANGYRCLWLYGERRSISYWTSALPEKFEDEAKEWPEYEVVKVGYPDTNKRKTLKDILEKADFKEVLWDKEWNKETVKEITAEEAAKLLKEKFPEYGAVKITV